MMTTMSIVTEASITGMVTFGGCAARLRASTGMLAHNTTIHNAKLLLAKNTIESNLVEFWRRKLEDCHADNRRN